MLKAFFSRAARAAPPAEKPHLASLNCAGADAPADAPAALWEAKQEWAANAPRGQKWKRQQALSEFVHELLRQEVGR